MRFVGIFSLGLTACAIAGDYSRVPIPSKRAYGRVRDLLFTPTSFQLKPVSVVRVKNSAGKIADSAQVFSLVFKGDDGQGLVVYFTTPRDSINTIVGIRQAALTRGTDSYQQALFLKARKVPIGVTSAQLMYVDPKSGRLESKVYRDRVACQLNLVPTKDLLLGQILLVLPDVNRSFVCGAFKVPRLP